MKYAEWEEDQRQKGTKRGQWSGKAGTDTCTQGRQHLPAGSRFTHGERVLHWEAGLRSSQEPPPQTLSFPSQAANTFTKQATGDCGAPASLGAPLGRARARPQLDERLATHVPNTTGAPSRQPSQGTTSHQAQNNARETPAGTASWPEPTRPAGIWVFHSKRPGLTDATHTFDVSERKTVNVARSQQLMAQMSNMKQAEGDKKDAVLPRREKLLQEW